MKNESITEAEKREWLKKATNEELLHQYVSFVNSNDYGRLDHDIRLTKQEILKRMGEK